MVKKRPRQRASRDSHRAAVPPASKLEAAYWVHRLFRNTYTYKGRRRAVMAWSVKIQLFGRRKTFTLRSSDRKRASVEACEIYQVLSTQGWEAVDRLGPDLGPGLSPTFDSSAHAGATLNEHQWKQRLIQRPYPKSDAPGPEREWSVRIEHAGVSSYFPLGTRNDGKAARKAMEIYQVVSDQGWEAASRRYSREQTVGFRWLDDPLAWTYTTLHTQATKQGLGRPAARRRTRQARSVRNVAIVEPDTGLRLALAACASRQSGFHCCAAYGDAAEALREILRQRIDLVLINYVLPDRRGATCLEALQRLKPTLFGILYSVFEDSEQLFKDTPGGAIGYLLKRTPASSIFDPLAETSGNLRGERVAPCVRKYFQRLVSAMPSGRSSLETAGLTPRELEVLALLSEGSLAKEIAESLRISTWTVHGHVKNIFEKLGVHTRTEAVVRYLQK